MSWSKDGRSLDDTGRFTFNQDGDCYSLVIPAALSTDSGTYCVKAASEEGAAAWSFSLHVAIGDSADEAKVQELLRSVEVLWRLLVAWGLGVCAVCPGDGEWWQ